MEGKDEVSNVDGKGYVCFMRSSLTARVRMSAGRHSSWVQLKCCRFVYGIRGIEKERGERNRWEREEEEERERSWEEKGEGGRRRAVGQLASLCTD